MSNLFTLVRFLNILIVNDKVERYAGILQKVKNYENPLCNKKGSMSSFSVTTFIICAKSTLVTRLYLGSATPRFLRWRSRGAWCTGGSHSMTVQSPGKLWDLCVTRKYCPPTLSLLIACNITIFWLNTTAEVKVKLSPGKNKFCISMLLILNLSATRPSTLFHFPHISLDNISIKDVLMLYDGILVSNAWNSALNIS